MKFGHLKKKNQTLVCNLGKINISLILSVNVCPKNTTL